MIPLIGGVILQAAAYLSAGAFIIAGVPGVAPYTTIPITLWSVGVIAFFFGVSKELM